MTTDPTDLILRAHCNGVTTLTMNMPDRLNGWTMAMMTALKAALDAAVEDDQTKVLILTGEGRYYCAGVNLGGTVRIAHPRKLHAMLIEHNEGLFNNFLDFPKPIIVAVNGPAIGASVTSATLCDAIVASERATFSTPFARLGLPAEGCSSVLFPKLLGEQNANRMLGREGWQPTGQESFEVGLVDMCVPHEHLLDEAQQLAEQWAKAGRPRTFRGQMTRDELKATNKRESAQVADAFLDSPFLEAQYRFLRSKGKGPPALMFFALWRTRPLWSRLLQVKP